MLRGTFKGFVMDLDWFKTHYDLGQCRISGAAFLHSLIETCRVMQLPWAAFGASSSQIWPPFIKNLGGTSKIKKLSVVGDSEQMQVCGFEISLEDYKKYEKGWSSSRLLIQSVFSVEQAHNIHNFLYLWPIWANIPPAHR